MAVGEIILTAFITVLFEKLSSSELLNFARREGIDTQLKKWSDMLLAIEAVLGDAEDKQITERAVKRWLEFLTDLAYDLDDVVDDLATVALRRELMMAEPQASTSNKVWKFIPTCCTNYYTTPSAVKFDYNMKSKIEDITSRLQDIETQKNVLDLKVNILGGVRSNNTVREMYLPTTSLVDESSVYGREKDKEAILELLRGESSDENVSVIPILGMGGVGKTTLAQLVYNDVKVKDSFDLKAWACVSDDFDVSGVTKEQIHISVPLN
uniref:Putative disease resistance RPP13-like protein 1 n=1 Tax=Davidia involucrata TaxID=16924 RepID=A0A5B6ZY34_DAVIN